ncbi:MAG: hypothetical protein U5K33_08960 [Halofilum sp. (in: g-proteobacteria)]|nr:hypothetical protein [Halofilum sp. (in: g-proteobacteria)]
MSTEHGISYAGVAAAAATHGLILRGGFHPGPEEDLSAFADGDRVATVILVGNAGNTLWGPFSASPEYADGEPHPLDRWSRRVIDGMATTIGGSTCYPNDGPPWPPFIAWAKRGGPVVESPIGILVHPDYGLWHAYRGALLLPQVLDLPVPDNRPAPCRRCRDQPCRTACPVRAFTSAGYDVSACADFLAGADGPRCGAGCLARRACPVGQEYNYPRAQQALHLDAFVAAQGREPRFGGRR